jgi:probable F420-dependent oxidoreductase
MRVHYHELSVDLTGIERSARTVERLGFDGYATREFRSDPMLQLVLAAKATKNVTLETRIMLAYPRSPMVVAYQAWALQAFSGGRLRLGLGSSARPQIEGRFAANWYPSGRGLRDYMAALQAIWTAWERDEHPAVEGEFFAISSHNDEFKPAPIGLPAPELALAATGPVMCRTAGEIANYLLLPILNSPKFIREKSIPAMRAGARQVGRDPAGIQVTSSAIVYSAKNRENYLVARERARREVAFFVCYSDIYTSVLEVHGWQDKHRYLRGRANDGESVDVLFREIDDEMLDAFAVVGVGDEIGPLLRDRYEGILDEVVFALRPVGLNKRDQELVLAKSVEALHR